MKKNKIRLRRKKPHSASRSGANCPICGQFMDVMCAGHQSSPFVDYKCYPRICFGCYNVPKREEQVLDSKGTITEVIDLPFGPRHLHTAEELLAMGAVGSKQEATKCIRGVREAIRKADLPRKRPTLKPPSDPRLILND